MHLVSGFHHKYLTVQFHFEKSLPTTYCYTCRTVHLQAALVYGNADCMGIHALCRIPEVEYCDTDPDLDPYLNQEAHKFHQLKVSLKEVIGEILAICGQQ